MKVSRWRVLIAAALSTLLLTAGCARIPTSGPIEEVPVPEMPGGFQIAPQPPQVGDEATKIVEGFLLATADPESDFTIAKTYLTKDAAKIWDPKATTTVYEGLVAEGPDEDQQRAQVRLDGTVVGSLDEFGRFEPSALTLSHDFGLVHEGGQWRISRPPDGVLISRYLFERFYSPVTIYFIEPSGKHVMPDFVVFPEADLTPTSVLQALLHGPDPRLAGSLTNALPDDARLDAEGTTIDTEGVVTVAFDNLPATMSSQARRWLGAQLLWSLTAIPRVTGLRVMNSGMPFAIPGQSAEGVLELATQQTYSVLANTGLQDLFGVQGGVAGRFTDNERFVPLRAGLPSAAEVAISLDGDQMAVVDSERTGLYLGTSETAFQAVSTGLKNLRSAQWVLGRFRALGETSEGDSVLLQATTKGDVQQLPIEVPKGMTVQVVAINQFGGTAAVLAKQGDEVVLGRMTLRSDGALTGWQQMPVTAPSGGSVQALRDVAWSSESTLALVGDSERGQGVFLLRADGSEIEELSSVDERIDGLAALPRTGGGLLALRTTSASVWRYSAPNRWTKSQELASSITYAG